MNFNTASQSNVTVSCLCVCFRQWAAALEIPTRQQVIQGGELPYVMDLNHKFCLTIAWIFLIFIFI